MADLFLMTLRARYFSQEQSMSDSIQSKIGPLRSTMLLTLHTHHAARIWQGRPASENKPPIMSFSRFIGLMGRINFDAQRDDPYADFWLIRIEEKLQHCKAELAHIHQEVNLLMSEMPSAISVQENFSVRPASLPIFVGSKLGFLAVYLLITYDDIVRRLLHVHHVSLIGRRATESRIDGASHVLRSLFGLAQKYKISGVTRADFAANNDRAREAKEAFGELPLDVLEGRRRAEFAPQILVGRKRDDRAVSAAVVKPVVWGGVASGNALVQVIADALEG